MNCTQIQQLIPEWLDGELDAGTAKQIKEHLAICAACNAEAAFWHDVSIFMRESIPNIKAPPDFAAAVMNQITRQPSTTSGGLLFKWKRSIALAATFMLVALGSAGAYLQWGNNIAGQLASGVKGNPVQAPYTNIHSSGQNLMPNFTSDNVAGRHTDTVSHTGDTKSDDGKTIQPGVSHIKPLDNLNHGGASTSQVNDAGPAASDRPTATSKPAASALSQQQYVLLSTDKNRVIDRIFLKVKVDDLEAAHKQALSFVSRSNGSYEVISSEKTFDGNQESLKITVNNNLSQELLVNLRQLGQVLNNDPQRVDINARYKDKIEEYQDLTNQLKNADPTEQEQIRIKMASIEAQLKDWDNEANTDTIILWLET